LKNKSENIIWQNMSIKRNDRKLSYGHKSILVWFTGLSGSGKSTIANIVEQRLFSEGIKTITLDGDNIRHGLNQDLGFSACDRDENIRRIAEVCKLFVEAGIVTLACFVSPLKKHRSLVRDLLGDDLLEVFVRCDLKVCEQRDPKGLYAKARNGEIKDFTGIDAPYEEPTNPDIKINTEILSKEKAADIIISYIKNRILE